MAAMKVLNRNLPYIRQQLLALVGNTSVFVKFICVAVIVTYFLSFSEEAVKVISVTPGFLLPPVFWIWTAFTFCFLEIHFWEVCVDIITVGLCGKLIEPLWGAFEMMTFFAIVNVGVALLSSVFYLLLYMCTFNTDLLFSIQIHGLSGYIAGISVAVKQIMPDHLIAKTPLGKISNKNIPMLILFIYICLWLLGLCERTNPTMFASGLLVSWIYLRFYQYHTNGSRGDMADNFTFASFFPNVLQPPIGVVSNTVYSGLVRIGLCRKTVRKFDLAAAPTGVTVTLPGNDPQDMERRRQIALKALSERLSKVEHPQVKSQRVKGDTTISIPVLPLPTTPLIPPAVTAINMDASPAPSTNT
ncbi:transmembrane protein 115-like [Macrosteles quadrilineatus]|uniref:transmembrane protein 115-like n=1 Tax=Macrosteles quadrilineatus TaxID=74068 RepID=UPI0023E0B3A0|nr:transmembrane protein 115-like [Macrosteles quadrilineatus]XP_054276831.1 transmembrane protein 115-like [Macrosteles quadrilineatus]